MPITYTYYPNEKVVMEHPSGVITFDEVEHYFEKVWNDDEIPSGVVDVISFEEIESFEGESWKVKEIMNKPNKKYIAVIFVASEPYHFGMARMFQSIIESTNTAVAKIVSNTDEAFQQARELLKTA
ncbi:MAG: hypothetical protein AAF387_00430 [Pseudomonadota bacterium]